MTELSRLISRLQRGIARNASYVKTIRHPQLLVASLQELNELIGNAKVKDAVATQVSHLIMIKRRALENTKIKKDDVMLNTVLYGPPGVGKTLVGTKLAKIWYSLGYLNGSDNPKDKKQGLKDLLKGFKDNSTSTTTTTTDSGFVFYAMFIFIMLLLSFLSLVWGFYNKFGGIWTLVAMLIVVFIIIAFAYFISTITSDSNSTVNTKSIDDLKTKDSKKDEFSTFNMTEDSGDISNYPMSFDVPSDDQILSVVSRNAFVGKFLGSTAPKTQALLEENLGKVLFVDECYSLCQGPHDEYGMEALTTLNLFLSQHPGDIIVIFAGYKDLIEAGPFAVQPGLKRRFMWQFESAGYNEEELYEIMKLQAYSDDWSFTNENETKRIIRDNYDAFEGYGGDTKRALFFAQLEHSREYIGNEKISITGLTPRHILLGIDKLRENNMQSSQEESSNPMANVMKMFRGNKPTQKPTKNSPQQRPAPVNKTNEPYVVNHGDIEIINDTFSNGNFAAYSDKSEFDTNILEELIEGVINRGRR